MHGKEQILKELGSKVKEQRIKCGLTQVDLASRMGKDQQSIQRLEAGRVNPTYLYLLEISKGLNIDISDLLQIKE